MKAIKIAPGVKKHLYPLDWDPTCSDKSFNEWHLYIREQLDEYYPKEIQESKDQYSVVNEANKILGNEHI